jgi:hypothetical protein
MVATLLGGIVPAVQTKHRVGSPGQDPARLYRTIPDIQQEPGQKGQEMQSGPPLASGAGHTSDES